MSKGEKKPVDKPCYFCKAWVDSEECFCYGCEQVVCAECMMARDDPWGGHDVSEHVLVADMLEKDIKDGC